MAGNVYMISDIGSRVLLGMRNFHIFIGWKSNEVNDNFIESVW